jgi:nicotinate-nucleotide adenylyltransferase
MTPSPIEVGAAPVPASARRVVVFGGTFDPPHAAHIELPIAARDRLGADWLLYVVARRSPHKDRGPAASPAARLDMLRAALQGRARVSISDWEIEHAGKEPSYTVDTLRALRARLGDGTRLRLLIGSDQAAAFHRWREPGEIIALAEPAVLLRAPLDSRESLIQELTPHWSEAELQRWHARILDVPVRDAAAMDARALLLREGPSGPRVRALIPESVVRVIRERGLYGSR